MSYVVHITRGGIVLADAAALGNGVSGSEILRITRDGANGAAPVLGGVPDTQLFGELLADATAGDINAYTRDSFAAVLGTLAGILAVPLGPIIALGFDQATSEAFKYGYNKIGDWSKNQDWTPLFDGVDELLDELKTPDQAHLPPKPTLIFDEDGASRMWSPELDGGIAGDRIVAGGCRQHLRLDVGQRPRGAIGEPDLIHGPAAGGDPVADEVVLDGDLIGRAVDLEDQVVSIADCAHVAGTNAYYDGWGNDTYQFGRGDGQDFILDLDASGGNLDKIVFRTGIAESDVQAERTATTSRNSGPATAMC